MFVLAIIFDCFHCIQIFSCLFYFCVVYTNLLYNKTNNMNKYIHSRCIELTATFVFVSTNCNEVIQHQCRRILPVVNTQNSYIYSPAVFIG